MAVIGIDNRFPDYNPSVFKSTSTGGQFTSFLIDPQYLLSVGHGIGIGNHQFTNGDISASGFPIYEDKSLDLAIFQLHNPISDVQPLSLDPIVPSEMPLGLSITGYPGDLGTSHTDTGSDIDLRGDYIIHTMDTYGGSSGSPIFNHIGDVVGIHRGTTGTVNIGIAITDALLNQLPVKQPNQPLLEETDLVHRFLNLTTGAHYYTDAEEIVQDLRVDSVNWVEEYSTIESSSEGLDIHQYYNTLTGGYFYTGDSHEMDYIDFNLHHFEYSGIGFELGSSVDMYRMYNEVSGRHFYTESSFERDYLIDNHGFTHEGVL